MIKTYSNILYLHNFFRKGNRKLKKRGLLNSEISYLISKLGHTDSIVISDAGLPIPDDVQRIDLALLPGKPPFLEVLEAVLTELEVEKVTIASEMKINNPELYEKIKYIFKNIKIEEISHNDFKVKTERAKAIIRTGEFAPFANIILQAGVVF